MQEDTIFALSSGQAPAAIAVIRISGKNAGTALQAICGEIPPIRRPVLRHLRDPTSGAILDRSLVLWFPGTATATGEDLAELHVHGGKAVIRAVEACLSKFPGLRAALAGEFTRRAFLNGRMDLAEAEGLADLLSAETEWQRHAAMSLASGKFSLQIESWREEILRLSALVEAELDFSDEDDVTDVRVNNIRHDALQLHTTISLLTNGPAVEKLHQGVRVVLAGPPNSGKSTLLNAIVAREAAIVSDIAGTTRDIIDIPVALNGVPFVFTDTAGLRDESTDTVEMIGIARARNAVAQSDILLWLGPDGEAPDALDTWEIETQIDAKPPYPKTSPVLKISAKTGENIDVLLDKLQTAAANLLPKPDSFAINARQKSHLDAVSNSLMAATRTEDLLMIGEELRLARFSLDGLLGRTHTEDMLDTLFGRFCIGK